MEAEIVESLVLTNSLLTGIICLLGVVVGGICGIIFFGRFRK